MKNISKKSCTLLVSPPNMAFGVSCKFEDTGELTFVVGEEVQPGIDAGQLGPGYVHMELPAGTYAEFKAYGPRRTRCRKFGIIFTAPGFPSRTMIAGRGRINRHTTLPRTQAPHTDWRPSISQPFSLEMDRHGG
ncbi:hypothetical protein DQX05_22655 [Paenibacillus thiaminolyticus]|uniref:Uncharacterized protein n=1 Tax=Paenibacillus thiaminolyticus TaxID=49283 RepID=A0A3A3GYD0_PANTH|nr:hypothetical protein DQX05_22655 [Paenibacillus thiaminolyticus]